MAPSLSGPSTAVSKKFDSIAQTIFARPPETVPFNCLTALLAVLPTAAMTFGSHYMHYRRLKGDPKRKLSYHEGVAVVEAFLYYSSFQTIEQMQAFTLQKVPSPRWAKVIHDTIPPDIIDSAANLVINQLGDEGIARVGGKKWWQWRGPGDPPLDGEWIEMKNDYQERKKNGDTGNRVIMYLHGGAFYFGSVNSHRYQIQRHARMLKARAFAIDYRLAPQYPFPCALQDVLAAYLYLLALYSPREIVVVGDSAGASLAISMLVTLRDQKLSLPAGVILVSPWVDLTASFPSMGEEESEDYLPNYGLMQAPSILFPPPNCDEIDQFMKEYKEERGVAPRAPGNTGTAGASQDEAQGYSLDRGRQTSRDVGQQEEEDDDTVESHPHLGRRIPPLVAEVAGELVEIKDQIWPYTTNDMLAHPLTSPIFQPSLGGLPPMMVISGGGERLRDEQAYLAHKAANPTKYAPDQTILEKFDPTGRIITSYPPTQVYFQVYDGLCHDALALFQTWPVKCMFFSIAQFAAKCLADAQETVIEIPDSLYRGRDKRKFGRTYQWGRVGDPIPPFENNMIRQRVDPQGAIYPMEPPEKMPALNYPNTEIGRIQSCIAVNWLAAKKLWDMSFKKSKLKVQKQRMKEMRMQIQRLEPDEIPPACSQASRYNLPVPPRKLPRGGHILTVWNTLGSAIDTRSQRRRPKPEHDLKIGTEHIADSVRRTSAAPNAGMASRRRSTAYGIQPRTGTPGTSRMTSRAGSRAGSIASPEAARVTSPKRLASMDVTGMSQAGAGTMPPPPQQPTAGKPSVATNVPPRRESSIAPPPALMNPDGSVSSQRSPHEASSGYPSTPEGQRFSSFAKQGGVSGDAKEPSEPQDTSDLSPGSTIPEENRQRYSSITAPIINADKTPGGQGDDDGMQDLGESPNATADPADRYLLNNRQRFPKYHSPNQPPNAGKDEVEGDGEDDYDKGRPQPYRSTTSGIAMAPNGATGDASTRTVIDQAGVVSPSNPEPEEAPSEEDSSLDPMLPPKAPTRVAQARREEAAAKRKRSIVNEASADLNRVDSVLGYKAPIEGMDGGRVDSIQRADSPGPGEEGEQPQGKPEEEPQEDPRAKIEPEPRAERGSLRKSKAPRRWSKQSKKLRTPNW